MQAGNLEAAIVWNSEAHLIQDPNGSWKKKKNVALMPVYC